VNHSTMRPVIEQLLILANRRCVPNSRRVTSKIQVVLSGPTLVEVIPNNASRINLKGSSHSFCSAPAPPSGPVPPSSTPLTAPSAVSTLNNSNNDENEGLPDQTQQIFQTSTVAASFKSNDPGVDDRKTTATDSSSSSNPDPPIETRKRVYGSETNPPLPSSTQSIRQSEENWEEADTILRRQQAIAEKKSNQVRADNVMRAIKGNVVICIAKFGAWTASGSSALLSEFIHSLVDTLNQCLILVGLRDSNTVADRKHPYGYGKSLYFWSLISAMGTFWMGAGIAGRHSIEQLLHPSLSSITWEVWSVLVFSFLVDGYVLTKTIADVKLNQPKGVTLWQHIWNTRDPALMAILLEDGAACFGVVMAGGGIALTAASGMPIFDGLAGVGISGLLAGMGLVLVRLNKEFLLGQAQDRKTIEGIQRILLEQESIEHVHSMQSQVLGHGKFSFKAEVDFDGTYLAAKLMPRYQKEFGIVRDNLDQELRVLLSWFAEDVMRTVEREVRRIEYEIRKVYPGAVFIELEPYSKDFYRYAVDDAVEGKLKRIEIEALNRYLKSLYMDSFEKLSNQATIPEELKPSASSEEKIKDLLTKEDTTKTS
jgi:zinc transporter 9